MQLPSVDLIYLVWATDAIVFYLQSVPEHEDSDDEIVHDETFVFPGLYHLDEA
jgi:hypothetical protein